MFVFQANSGEKTVRFGPVMKRRIAPADSVSEAFFAANVAAWGDDRVIDDVKADGALRQVRLCRVAVLWGWVGKRKVRKEEE